MYWWVYLENEMCLLRVRVWIVWPYLLINRQNYICPNCLRLNIYILSKLETKLYSVFLDRNFTCGGTFVGASSLFISIKFRTIFRMIDPIPLIIFINHRRQIQKITHELYPHNRIVLIKSFNVEVLFGQINFELFIWLGPSYIHFLIFSIGCPKHLLYLFKLRSMLLFFH